MYLSTVVIRSFRNINELTVHLRLGLNVIVGANNVGKTNFTEAIQVALGQLNVSEDDIPVDKSGNRSTAPIRIDLLFAGLTEAEQAQYLDILDFNAIAPKESTASIHFECVWPAGARRPSCTRWAGNRQRSEAAVPDDVLQSIRVTFLNALRNATAELLPGRQSRLGKLLKLLSSEAEREEITKLIRAANKSLQTRPLVNDTQKKIQQRLTDSSGEAFKQDILIGTAEPRFESIANSLRIVLSGSLDANNQPVSFELDSNGLGYNNLIYIATVMTELAAGEASDTCVLIVEEPEAHLHPQLQCVLASFLSKRGAEGTQVQTILTTHSPTIVSHVSPDSIQVMHSDASGTTHSARIDSSGLTPRELKEVRRLLDVTKATMLFANGVILVEGISEAFLVPALARRLGTPLDERGISVIPVYGVDFSTLTKLFGSDRLRIPVAVVTDGDPGETAGKKPVPLKQNGKFLRAARIGELESKQNDYVQLFVSDVTLEYDLAAAGAKNPELMVAVWESCYERRPRSLTKKILEDCGSDIDERVCAVWRGICLRDTAVSKPEFAQKLAAEIDQASVTFAVPEYIKRAIAHVLPQQTCEKKSS